jgi:hypothetical protein
MCRRSVRGSGSGERGSWWGRALPSGHGGLWEDVLWSLDSGNGEPLKGFEQGRELMRP